LQVINLVSKRIKAAPCVNVLPWEEILERANNSAASPFSRNFSLVFLDTAFRRCADRSARHRIITELANLTETEQQLCPSVERARKVQMANKNASSATPLHNVVVTSKSATSEKNANDSNTQWSIYSAAAAERYKADAVVCSQPKRLSSDELALLTAQSCTSEELAGSSALHDNITSKGSNSYYHAHQRKGPAAPSMAPTLVHAEKGVNGTIDLSGVTDATINACTSNSAIAASAAPAPRVVGISTYGFLDETGKARVYIDFPGASELPKEQVVIDFQAKSFVLTVTVKNEDKAVQHVLKVDELYGEITKITAKQKKDKLVLTLTKKMKHSTWYSLKG
jgi:hypothetical protein